MIRQVLRRLYYQGRDAIPLPLRRAIRRVLPVERLFAIRKEAFDPGEVPEPAPEDIPGRPDLVVLPGADAAGSALLPAGFRVFVADPGAPDFAVAAAGRV